MALGNLRTSLLPVVDGVRGLPGLLGLRIYTVQVCYETWVGTDASGRSGFGIGTKTLSPLQSLRVDQGGASPHVRQVSQKDIIASGNLYQDQDLKVGPITPPYTGSTKDEDQISIFDPPSGMPPEAIHFFVTGPGYASGAWFRKIGDKVDDPISWFIFLRKNAVTP